MKIHTHYKCPFTGEEFTHEDVAGYGNPPASPCTPVGTGSVPLIPVVTDVPDDSDLAREMKNYAVDIPPAKTMEKRDLRLKELKDKIKQTQTKK